MNTIKKAGVLMMLPVAVLAFSGCGVKKMVKRAGDVSYEVTPNPLELHGDSVRITVNGTMPTKYFHKKASVTVTPVVKYDGGEKELKNIVLKGDKVEGSGQSISFKEGGKFTVTDRFLYTKGMENADVMLRARIQHKKKETELPEVKIAEGTIVTPLLLQPDYKPVTAGDKFDKNPTVTQKSNIYYLVDQWDVRPVELRSDEMNNMYRFVEKAARDSSEFVRLDIYGYASPEGELKRNAMLSENRADAAYKVMKDRFTRAKLKDLNTREGFYNKITTNYEDWDGLKQMLQNSEMTGKDQALNIINTVNDPEMREQQFRELASYDPIYETYFPKLRRAEINLIARLKTRKDDKILEMSTSAPDSLGMEELLYSSTLTEDETARFRTYENYARRFPEDYRGFNNMGVVYLNQGKLNEAQAEFEKANRIAPNDPIVQNNLGVVAALRGDKKAAESFFTTAGNTPEVTYNKANLEVAKGNYSAAVSGYGNACTFNAALAKLLAGNPSGATQTLDCSPEKESANAHYLKAIISARSGNKDEAVRHLQMSIAADGSMKAKARNDREFRSLQDDQSFKGLVN